MGLVVGTDWLLGRLLFVFRWGAKLIFGDCAVCELQEIFAVLFLVLIVGSICFWMAARDLKRYPGLRSARH